MKALQFLLLAMMVGLFVSCGDSGESTEGETTTDNTETTDGNTETATTASFSLGEGTQVMWVGTKAEGAHYGTFDVLEGSVEMTGDQISGGSVIIDLNSLAVKDEMPEDKKGKLKGHLTSNDFFNTEEFPETKLVLVSSETFSGDAPAAPEGLPEEMTTYAPQAPTHTINAQLNVKGVSSDISFPAKVTVDDNGMMTAKALVTFDRRDYGLRFKSDTESTVNPEIHIGVSFTAKK